MPPGQEEPVQLRRGSTGLSNDAAHGVMLSDQRLTPRERSLCMRLLGSQTEKEIAESPGLSFATTRNYTQDLYRKFGVQGRTEADGALARGRAIARPLSFERDFRAKRIAYLPRLGAVFPREGQGQKLFAKRPFDPSSPMKLKINTARPFMLAGFALFACLVSPVAQAGVLTSPSSDLDPPGFSGEGSAVSVSGDNALVGGYFFSGLSSATGTIVSNLSLASSDLKPTDFFGDAASLSGNMALIGARVATVLNHNEQGSAYLFRNVTTATGRQNEQAHLLLRDGAEEDHFGYSLSLSGSRALVATSEFGGNTLQTNVYLYTGLDTATGTVYETARLAVRSLTGYVPFQGVQATVAMDGAIGVVAPGGTDAYLYRGLDTLDEGTVGQNAILRASDGAGLTSASVSGSMALFGGGDTAAYLFRNLDTATGTVNDQVKLAVPVGGHRAIASLSGNTALIGSPDYRAYLYLGMDTATGTVNPDVELRGSDDLNVESGFGSTASLSGDNFLIGLWERRAVSGSVSSLTTLDVGHASRTIDGLSFVAHGDWVIGKTTDGNAVTLSSNDVATVTDEGKAVFIGQSAGSDDNTLTVEGTLTATTVHIGADGNTGNQLVVKGALNASAVTMSDGILTLALVNPGGTLTLPSFRGTGRVQLGANTLAVGSSNLEGDYFLGVIDGNGSLVKEGTGTFSLGGANTYTGGTTVKSGGLVVANDGENTFGRLGGGTTTVKGGAGLTGRGALSFTGSASAEAANIVIEGGTAAGMNGGQLLFNNTTTAGNAAIVAQGGTNGGGGASILLQDSSTGGTAQFDVRGNATLSLSFHAAGTVSIGSLAGDGSVAISTRTLATGSNNLSTSFSGVISGAGALIKDGAGTFILGGANTYTGTTTINAGTLRVNGSLASATTTVKNGAILGGTGSLRALTLESGATLAPGDSLGTLSAASLTWNADATLVFDLGAAATSDLLDLSGNLTKSGAGTFRFTFQNAGWQIGQTYTLIAFDGTTNFSASDFSFTNASGFDGAFTITGNSVQFTPAAVPEPGTWTLLLAGLFATGIFLRRPSALPR